MTIFLCKDIVRTLIIVRTYLVHTKGSIRTHTRKQFVFVMVELHFRNDDAVSAAL